MPAAPICTRTSARVAVPPQTLRGTLRRSWPKSSPCVKSSSADQVRSADDIRYKSAQPPRWAVPGSDGRCLARTGDLLLVRREQVVRFAAGSRSGGSTSDPSPAGTALCCGLPFPKTLPQRVAARTLLRDAIALQGEDERQTYGPIRSDWRRSGRVAEGTLDLVEREQHFHRLSSFRAASLTAGWSAASPRNRVGPGRYSGAVQGTSVAVALVNILEACRSGWYSPMTLSQSGTYWRRFSTGHRA